MGESGAACKVWSRFEGKRKDGKLVKLRFQELPLDRTEEAIELNNTYMLRDESCHKASGVYKNKEALQEYNNIIGKLFEVNPPHVTCCCIDDGSEGGGELAAVSILLLMNKNDSFSEFLKHFEVNTKEMQILLKAAHILEEASDLGDQFDSHYHGRGIIVHPDYRGMGIANELVKIRKLICEEHNVPMTSAWMTAKGSQRAAEKHQWHTHTEVEPRDLSEKTGLKFDDDALVFKLMYIEKD